MRREELDLEELLSRSEFPFSEAGLLRDFPLSAPQPELTDENPRLREIKWPPPASQPGRPDCQGPPHPTIRRGLTLREASHWPRARACSSCLAKNGEQLVPVSCLGLRLPSLSLLSPVPLPFPDFSGLGHRVTLLWWALLHPHPLSLPPSGVPSVGHQGVEEPRAV